MTERERRMKLFHFTCEDAAPIIVRERLLRPGPLWGIVWLTDQPHPERFALGLTSHSLTCDRMAWRFIVKTDGVPWSQVRDEFPAELVRAIETAPLADPARWFIARMPCRVTKGAPYRPLMDVA